MENVANTRVYGKIDVGAITSNMPFPKVCQHCNREYSVKKRKEFENSKFCSKRCWYDERANLVISDGRTLKRCAGCAVIKSLSSYHSASANRVIGVKAKCKECVAAIQQKYCKENATHRNNLNKQWRARNLEYARERDSGYTQKLRREVISALGGFCVCCGESELGFLSIDHINNDGAEHRREVGTSASMYRDVRRQNYPKDKFQVLCYNCNQAKQHCGICPHKKEWLQSQ